MPMNDYPNAPHNDPNQPQGPPPYGSGPQQYQPLPPRYQRGDYGAPPPPRRGSIFWRIITLFFLLGFICIVGLVIFGTLSMYGTGNTSSLLAHGDRIGLVRVEGLIGQGADKQFWLDSLQELGNNPRVKGVIVRIDSPGGTVGASQELYEMVVWLREKKQKPVYVSMGDVAASGGYYMASAADRIFSNRGTLTGSIGVILSKPDVGSLVQKLGIQMETIKSGRFKDAGSMTRPLTADERKMFDYLINDTYHQFMSDVLKFRAKPLQQAMGRFTPELWTEYQFTRPAELTPENFLTQIADGRAYTGRQALQLGLVDEFGTLDDTIRAMADLVHITGEPQLQEMTRRRSSLRDLLSSKMGDILPASQSTLQYRMELP